jgi:hypothetical protein
LTKEAAKALKTASDEPYPDTFFDFPVRKIEE